MGQANLSKEKLIPPNIPERAHRCSKSPPHSITVFKLVVAPKIDPRKPFPLWHVAFSHPFPSPSTCPLPPLKLISAEGPGDSLTHGVRWRKERRYRARPQRARPPPAILASKHIPRASEKHACAAPRQQAYFGA